MVRVDESITLIDACIDSTFVDRLGFSFLYYLRPSRQRVLINSRGFLFKKPSYPVGDLLREAFD